jgi:DNA-binding HxlR family transcriptional regulator
VGLHALEIVGLRWTLLIIGELLVCEGGHTDLVRAC